MNRWKEEGKPMEERRKERHCLREERQRRHNRKAVPHRFGSVRTSSAYQ